MTASSRIDTRSWPFMAPAIHGLSRPVLVIGNFDGVHLGHHVVMAEARLLADSLGKAVVVLTFEPHPRDVFNPSQPVFRLTPLEQKAELLTKVGADAILALDFNLALLNLSPEAFIDELLIGACQACAVVVGHDFHFGKGRAGTPHMLAERLGAAHIPCIIVPPQHQAGDLLSSRAIRTALEAGEIESANAALGREWAVSAIVAHGDKRGRELGFPTANLHLPLSCKLRHGIYAVRGSVHGVTHNAIASFGRRPTFDDGRPKLEVMLFDFGSDIYDKRLDVAFVGWIRGEERFESVKALIAQMNLDCAKARRVLEVAGQG